MGGAAAPNVKLGPSNISSCARDRKLKLNTQLSIVKYSLIV